MLVHVRDDRYDSYDLNDQRQCERSADAWKIFSRWKTRPVCFLSPVSVKCVLTELTSVTTDSFVVWKEQQSDGAVQCMDSISNICSVFNVKSLWFFGGMVGGFWFGIKNSLTAKCLIILQWSEIRQTDGGQSHCLTSWCLDTLTFLYRGISFSCHRNTSQRSGEFS